MAEVGPDARGKARRGSNESLFEVGATTHSSLFYGFETSSWLLLGNIFCIWL